jgi:hypothetical protein
MANEFETEGIIVGAGTATFNGVGPALRGTELDSGHRVLPAPFTSGGAAAWETVDTFNVTLSLDGSMLVVASVEVEAAAAVAVAPKFRLRVAGNNGAEMSVDLLATQEAACVPLNHIHPGLTAGTIAVDLQVQDDGVTAVQVNAAIIDAIGLVQKG